MRAVEKQFLQKLVRFSEASVRWCCEESEAATSKISNAVDLILKDTKRVSRISEESQKAVRSLKTQIDRPVNAEKQREMRDFLGDLKKRCDDNQELKSLVYPLVQSLQFQDSFRQQLENQLKMLKLWLQERERVIAGGTFSPEDKQRFGTELLKNTVMQSERDIVAKHVPGMKTEKSSSEAQFF